MIQFCRVDLKKSSILGKTYIVSQITKNNYLVQIKVLVTLVGPQMNYCMKHQTNNVIFSQNYSTNFSMKKIFVHQSGHLCTLMV